MRLSKNIILANAVLVFWASACGIERSPHFKRKTFGQNDPMNTPELPVTDPPIVVANPSPPEETEQPEVPTRQVVGHYNFQGYFNMDTVRRVLNAPSGGEISDGGFLDATVTKLMAMVIGENPTETLDMLIVMNSGKNTTAAEPSTNQAEVTEAAITEGGDNISDIKNEESQSGTQYLDWAIPGEDEVNDCPKTFICIHRMVWKPVKGTPSSYCYYDGQTHQPTIIPMSANPNFTKDAFIAAIGNGVHSSPVEVVKLRGVTTCDDPERVVIDRKLVIYNISVGSTREQNQPGFLRKAKFSRLVADLSIDMEYSLYNPDTKRTYIPSKGPYIDQLTRLNSLMRFFINTTDNTFVKIDQIFQSQLRTHNIDDVIANIGEKYGMMAAYFAKLLLIFDQKTYGIQITHSFEFCTHLDVVKNPFNHCTGKTEP